MYLTSIYIVIGGGIEETDPGGAHKGGLEWGLRGDSKGDFRGELQKRLGSGLVFKLRSGPWLVQLLGFSC